MKAYNTILELYLNYILKFLVSMNKKCYWYEIKFLYFEFVLFKIINTHVKIRFFQITTTDMFASQITFVWKKGLAFCLGQRYQQQFVRFHLVSNQA